MVAKACNYVRRLDEEGRGGAEEELEEQEMGGGGDEIGQTNAMLEGETWQLPFAGINQVNGTDAPKKTSHLLPVLQLLISCVKYYKTKKVCETGVIPINSYWKACG